MGQEGLGPESALTPRPFHYSPVFALLFRTEKVVITHLKNQGEEHDWQGQGGPVIPQSKVPWPASSDRC